MISWKLFKKAYPFICDACGYLHYNDRVMCEGCGKEFKIRKILKIDYRIWKG